MNHVLVLSVLSSIFLVLTTLSGAADEHFPILEPRPYTITPEYFQKTHGRSKRYWYAISKDRPSIVLYRSDANKGDWQDSFSSHLGNLMEEHEGKELFNERKQGWFFPGDLDGKTKRQWGKIGPIWG